MQTRVLRGEYLIEYNPAAFKVYRTCVLKHTLYYYAGICEFEVGNTEGAIMNLLTITDHSSVYFFQAKYTLGLCYLKSDGG